MEPNSILLVVVLLVLAVSALWALARYRHLAVRIGAGALALVLAAVAGMAVVNDYYGYYQTWSQLSQDLNGSYTAYSTTTAHREMLPQKGHGRLESVTLAGAHSGIRRTGLVYLPPQYFEKRYAHTAFPVMELIHGSPGYPGQWIVHLAVTRLEDTLIAHHLMGPEVLVMPSMNAGRQFEEGVDGPQARDDTYLTQDVRADVEQRFRVSHDPAEWGIAGYSSGGYCAANLALRHRGSFGAAGVMDGYFRPQDGPAATALGHHPVAEAANDPLRIAAGLSGTGPVPAFWLSVGTGVRSDVAAARAFVAALRGIEQVTVVKQPGAYHNFYAWAPAVPHLLTWTWTQLAPPSLRVQFPVAGPVSESVVRAPLSAAYARQQKAARAAARARAAHRTSKIATHPSAGARPTGARPARRTSKVGTRGLARRTHVVHRAGQVATR